MRDAANNPFRISRLESLDWIPSPERIDVIYARWRSNDFRGQLWGPHGSGKTTLGLLLLQRAAVEGRPCEYLFANSSSTRESRSRWDRVAAEISDDTCVLMDGLEHLPGRLRRRMLRRVPRTLVTRHRPKRDLPIIARLESDPAVVQSLTQQLAGEEGVRLLGPDGGGRLLAHCNGNTREVFRILYRRWLGV